MTGSNYGISLLQKCWLRLRTIDPSRILRRAAFFLFELEKLILEFSLSLQLQRLRKLTEKGGNEEIQNEGNKLETEVIKSEFIPETCSPEFGLPLCEDSREIDYLGTESDILNMAQIAYGLSEIENECNIESRIFFDDSDCRSPLWEF